MDYVINKALEKLKSEKAYAEYVNNNPNFNAIEFLKSNFSYIASYLDFSNCNECKCLSECKNCPSGYIVNVIYDKKFDKLRFQWYPCEKKFLDISEKEANKNFLINHSNKLQLNIDFNKMKKLLKQKGILNPNKKEQKTIIENMLKICLKTLNNLSPKYFFANSKNNIGKTICAISLCNEFHKKYPDKKVAYVKIPILLQQIRHDSSNKNSFSMSRKEIIEYLSNCDLLVIDDIGIEGFYQWFHMEILYPIFESRLSSSDWITYIFSNDSLDNITNKYLSLSKNKYTANDIYEFIGKVKDFENNYKWN